MAKKGIIIVDTDILIKVYRGDNGKKNELEKLSGRLAISVITILELMQGANSQKKLFEWNKQAKAFTILHIDKNISELSYKLFKKYIVSHSIRIQDSLIAATPLHFNFLFLQTTKKIMNLLKGLNFIEKGNAQIKK